MTLCLRPCSDITLALLRFLLFSLFSFSFYRVSSLLLCVFQQRLYTNLPMTNCAMQYENGLTRPRDAEFLVVPLALVIRGGVQAGLLGPSIASMSPLHQAHDGRASSGHGHQDLRDMATISSFSQVSASRHMRGELVWRASEAST